jgi:hypothetical protein
MMNLISSGYALYDIWDAVTINMFRRKQISSKRAIQWSNLRQDRLKLEPRIGPLLNAPCIPPIDPLLREVAPRKDECSRRDAEAGDVAEEHTPAVHVAGRYQVLLTIV